MPLLPEKTIPYKTWIKTSLVEALREVFKDHPDTKLQRTKVSVEYPTSEVQYPSVVIRFFERTVRNAGIGHVEYLFLNEDSPMSVKFRHYLYDGDIEFAVFALSSKDRDLISDTLVQTLAMPDMASYTKDFFDRIYFPPSGGQGDWNYVNLNTDTISGFGETQTPQPWLSEDQLVYQTSYRVGIYGEFYSLPPISEVSHGLITKVNIYPYLYGETPPTGAHITQPGGATYPGVSTTPGLENDPSEWV